MISQSMRPGTARMLLAAAVVAAGLAASSAWYVSRAHALDDRGAQVAHHHAESPAVGRPELSGFAAVSREEVGQHVVAPAFHLVDQAGAAVSLDDLKGRTVLISFLYTNCPEACPLLTGNYLQLQKEFAEAIRKENLALVLITTDPERDTPSWLEDYTRWLEAKWLFLTGDEAMLEPVWREYEVYREVHQEKQDIVIYHSYRTYLLDPAGAMRVKYTGVWQTETVAADISKILE